MTESNILKIIFDNFKLEEFDIDQLNSLNFLKRPTLSFNKLLNRLLEKLKIRNSYLINQSILDKVSFNLNINDLLATKFNLNDYLFVRMMSIKSIDLNARDKYLIKQKLNSLFKFHLEIIYDNQLDKCEFLSIIDNQKNSLSSNPFKYLNQLKTMLNNIENDDYCEYLRNLYYQNLFDLQFLEFKTKDHDQFNQINKTKLQYINETFKVAIDSGYYYKIFKSILNTNQISNSTLNDEICLFTTNWTYLKSIIQSLKDEICKFIQISTKLNLINHKKDNKFNQFELIDDFVLENDLDDQKFTIKKNRKNLLDFIDKDEDIYNLINLFINKNDDLFEFFLNELNFLTIDLTRDLIIFLVDNINDRPIIDSDEQLVPSTFQLMMFDNSQDSSKKSSSKFTINLNIDLTNTSNLKFINQLKIKLQSFVNKLYNHKMLKKQLQNLNHEPDIEIFLSTIWLNIIKIINDLNDIDQSYFAEIFLANKCHLLNSSSFISRKYLYFIIRNLFEKLYLILSTIYDKFPIRLINELNKNKIKLDNLIDQAFLIHLKDESLTILADTDSSIQIEKPNLTKSLNEPITRQNIIEILSQLISLIRLKLLQCTYYSSPLYTEFVKINEKLRNHDDYFEKQININLLNILNLDNHKLSIIKDPTKIITDIIENEILMKYLLLIPKLECLEQVAEIGAEIVLNLGLKKNRK